MEIAYELVFFQFNYERRRSRQSSDCSSLNFILEMVVHLREGEEDGKTKSMLTEGLFVRTVAVAAGI